MRWPNIKWACSSGLRLSRTGLAVLTIALSFLVVAAPASAAPVITVTNVSCSSLGYSFTVGGSGFAPNTQLIVFIYDTVFTPSTGGQPNGVLTDASGSFTLVFSGGPAQSLPATVEVRDYGMVVLAGPVTVDPVTCGPPPAPDLVVTKMTTATTVAAGDPITYEITVANQGGAPAAGVTLADALVGATIASMTSTQGTCAPPSCSLGTIAPGASATVTLVAAATSAGTVSNSATATTTSPEPNVSNNTGTAPTVTVAAPPATEGCNKAGTIDVGGEYVLLDSRGKKLDSANVHVEVRCEYDKRTGRVVLRDAEVRVDTKRNQKLLDAETDKKRRHTDVASVTFADPGDAVITGTYECREFTVTLHDGGRDRRGDELEVSYDSFTTAAYVPKDVHVEIDLGEQHGHEHEDDD